MSKTKVIIFDLDGVLINSAPNMKYALSQTSKKLKIDLKFSIYSKFLGLPFDKIIKNMGFYKDLKLIKKIMNFILKKNYQKLKLQVIL